MDTAKLIRRLLTTRNPDPPCLPKGKGFSGFPDPPVLPSWLSDEDINYYASKFNQKGFTGGLNYYRAMNLYELLSMLSLFSPYHFYLNFCQYANILLVLGSSLVSFTYIFKCFQNL